MSKLTEYIGSQFGNPRGIVGFICCKCMNIINKKMYKKTVSLLTLDKSQKLLDIGYGNGYLLKIADKSFGCNLYGIDISIRFFLTKLTKLSTKCQEWNFFVC